MDTQAFLQIEIVKIMARCTGDYLIVPITYRAE